MSDSSNWVDDVMEDCSHVETPRSWLYWSLLAAISAACGNNYHLSTLKGALVIKPNIYVILLGESGLGKEFPVSLAMELVSRADVTRVIAGRSSIQAIVLALSQAVTRELKGPIDDSRGFIVNGELSTAIIQDPDSLTILTDLYDRKSKWSNLLKGAGTEKLKHPYITALFGSSPAHFYDTIPQVNIEGGYIGRNLIVYEEKRYKDTDLFSDADMNIDEVLPDFPFEKFIDHLVKISEKAGRLIPDPGAKDLFNEWRRRWRRESTPDKTGFNNRVPVHVLKTAMLLNLANYSSNLIITTGEMSDSIELVTSLTYANKRTTEGKGEDPLAKQTKMIVDFLLTAESNELTRKQLLTKGYGSFDTTVLDKIVSDLMEIGWVDRDRVGVGRNADWLIKLKGEPLAQYQKFLTDRAKKKVKRG